ncbi:JmjC domain-containing protein [Streptomyces sp. NPDC050535]|uniref:cupin domain-containing protein n=1 Tax=Streptomyces sp. NPDC050535 TaxID=3365626 RepID=UPI00378A6595
MTTEEFFRDIFGKQHAHFPGKPDRFAHLLTWQRLDLLLTKSRLTYPQLRLAKEGTVLEPDSFMRYSKTNRGLEVARVDPALLTRKFREGATVVISSVDELDEPVEDLASALEAELGVRVSVNVYASFGELPGFTNHWDDHDALVIQVDGDKEWLVHGMSRAWPLFRDVEHNPLPTSGPLARYVTHPGDVLYIPRGCWHEAKPIGKASLHLTFGFMRPTGIDFIVWLSDFLRGHEGFRASVPHRSTQEFAQFEEELLRQLREELRPGVLEQFLEDRDATAPARTAANLLWGLDPDDGDGEFTCRLLASRAYVEDDPGTPGEHVLYAGGQRIQLSDVAKPLTRLLLDGEWHSCAEMLSHCDGRIDRGSVVHLVKELHDTGLLAVRPHPGRDPRDTPANPG